MRQTPAAIAAIFLSCLFTISTQANAQIVFFPQPAVTLSTGYSNFQAAKTGSLFYDHSGPYFDADFAWAPPRTMPFEFGFGVTGSGYWDRRSEVRAGQ